MDKAFAFSILNIFYECLYADTKEDEVKERTKLPHDDEILFHLLNKIAEHKIVLEYCDEMVEDENKI